MDLTIFASLFLQLENKVTKGIEWLSSDTEVAKWSKVIYFHIFKAGIVVDSIPCKIVVALSFVEKIVISHISFIIFKMALNNIYQHIQECTIMSELELPVFKCNVPKELLNRQFCSSSVSTIWDTWYSNPC